MSRARNLNLAAAAYGWLAVVMALVPVSSGIRAAVVFTFALSCPGLPIVSRLHRRDPLEQLVLAVALSICLSTVVAEAMALSKVWSPAGGMAVLATLTTVGALLPAGEKTAAHAPGAGQRGERRAVPADPWSVKGE